MKILSTTIICLLFTTLSFAKNITILNNGKAGGSYNARTLMYKDGLEARGFNVEYKNIGKISQAVKIFKETNEPTIMVYSNNQVHKQDLYHTKNNFIMLEYQQPLYVCKTKAAIVKKAIITVAHGKGYDTNLLKGILGDQIILVPYKNSGAMLKGILGGDVDAMVNNQGKSLKYQASGEGICEVNSALPTMLATVIGTNVDIESLRKTVYEISTDKDFTEYHTSKKLARPSDTLQQELEMTIRSEELWTK